MKARYIPANSQPLQYPGVDAVVYINDRYAIGYRGKANNPC